VAHRAIKFESEDEVAFWQQTAKRSVAAMLEGFDLLEEEPEPDVMETFADAAATVADELVLQYRKRAAKS
jgi:hypothetical protein